MAGRPFTILTGAGRGIGRATALALADAGHDLALISRSDGERLEETANAVRERGAKCRTNLLDVANEREVARFFAGLGSECPSGLVNNAGLPGDRGQLPDVSMAMIDQVLAVNVRGPILMCRAALPLMRARGGGAVVNMSSQSAQFGGDGLSVYAASKGAVNGLTVSLAREAAPYSVRVNAVSPGPVMTEPLKALPEERLVQMQSHLPMGRFCRAEEVADVVVWLLSDHASYVNGAILPVHGAR